MKFEADKDLQENLDKTIDFLNALNTSSYSVMQISAFILSKVATSSHKGEFFNEAREDIKGLIHDLMQFFKEDNEKEATDG